MLMKRGIQFKYLSFIPSAQFFEVLIICFPKFFLCYEPYEGCMTCCCPCITFGQSAEVVDKGRTCE